MLPIWRLHRRGRNVCYITACGRLRDGDAGSFITGQQIGKELVMQGFASELDNWRNSCTVGISMRA